ncbi:DUF2288 domain-containing protein [Kaarinaea lacus]
MTGSDDNPDSPELLYQKLNLETGKISWPELQRYFARGVVIIVAKELDLVEVAQLFSLDRKDQIKDWLSRELIRNATDDDAKQWHNSQQVFWAVAVAPWVLIQST